MTGTADSTQALGMWRWLSTYQQWPSFERHPDQAALFEPTMVQRSRLTAAALISRIDFTRFATILDVAGGWGHKVLTTVKNQWDFSKLIDLDLLLLTGGKERTLAQWRELTVACGFELTGPPPGGSSSWAALECRPI